MFPEKLDQKLERRIANNAFRTLKHQNELVDFSSNDYLGFSRNKTIFNNAYDYLVTNKLTDNGATGSRLLSGNHKLYDLLETQINKYHNSDAALVFNSGYDANIGFFSSVPQRGDVILYDEFIHASIRDGISMSNAKAHKFKHNDLNHLAELLSRVVQHNNIFVVTESVFSMDGDSPDFLALSKISKKYNALLVVDEAHALGVFGQRGEGLIQQYGLEHDVFARIVTYGKAMGCHGAAILGSNILKDYLVNFCRSFIYTTALPPHSVATIKASYDELSLSEDKKYLQSNIAIFKQEVKSNNLNSIFIESNSAIHCCVISGNDTVKTVADKLQNLGFDVKPILSPTVPKGEERLRFCLHSYNTNEDIKRILNYLQILIKKGIPK